MLKRIFNFYYDGFRNMSGYGKKLWVIIILKLVIIFAVFKLFFFSDFLDSKYQTEEEKSEHVIEQLINKK